MGIARGQGGEDDAGCEAAALRVYFNIGMCAGECMVGHLANGPGGTQTPIDQAQCARICPDFVAAQKAVDEHVQVHGDDDAAVAGGGAGRQVR